MTGPPSPPGPAPRHEPPVPPVAPLLAVALLLGAGWILRDALGLEWSATSIRETVAGFGAWGPLIYVALFPLRLLGLVPGPLLLTAGGLAFPPLLATLYGGVGLSLPSLAIWAVVRHIGPERVLPPSMPGLETALKLVRSPAGAWGVAIGSAYPVVVGPTLQLAAALAAMPLLPFALAVVSGSLVRAGTYALFGNAIVEGRGLLIAALVLLAVCLLPLAFPATRAHLREILRARAKREPMG